VRTFQTHLHEKREIVAETFHLQNILRQGSQFLKRLSEWYALKTLPATNPHGPRRVQNPRYAVLQCDDMRDSYDREIQDLIKFTPFLNDLLRDVITPFKRANHERVVTLAEQLKNVQTHKRNLTRMKKEFLDLKKREDEREDNVTNNRTEAIDKYNRKVRADLPLYTKVILKKDTSVFPRELFKKKEYGIVLGYIDEKNNRRDYTGEIREVILAVQVGKEKHNKLKRYIRADWTKFKLKTNKGMFKVFKKDANKQPKRDKRRETFEKSATIHRRRSLPNYTT